MNSVRSQRGFVHSRVMDLVFLLVLILMAWGLWQWLSTIMQGEFALAVALTWLMAFAAAGWWSSEQRLVLRVPVGFLLFFGLSAVLGPLGWWSGSKLVVAASAIVAAFTSKYLGGVCSAKLEPKVMPGIPSPWWLDQSINLLHDVGRWVGASILVWFLVIVPPMLLVFVVPPECVPWAALVWAFVATAFYIYKYRPVRWRISKLPVAFYGFVITSVVLLIFQKQIAGPMEAGSFEQIAYVAFWPVIAALFLEFILVGTKRDKL